MKSIAYHMLDIVHNALRAKATVVDIALIEDDHSDLLRLQVSDNGSGMDGATLQRAIDPYYTSRKTRHVGLGLSLLKQNCERTDGRMRIHSRPGAGTTVRADFVKSHLDLPAIGDMPGTLYQIIVGNPDRDFIYHHRINTVGFDLDTRHIREALEEWPLDHPRIKGDIRELIGCCFDQMIQDSGGSVIEHP
ncbi:MAG: sensor histidine kinase [Bacteroidales bacterium]|nr:sensor histidine kinase [Bacteroidales bacterium]